MGGGGIAQAPCCPPGGGTVHKERITAFTVDGVGIARSS